MTETSTPRAGTAVRGSFDAVVEQHGATVLRVCRVIVGPHDADDAWSETFLAALRAWPTLPPDANVEAWLVTIAHRKAIDIVRARRTVPLEHAREPVSAHGVPGDGFELWARVAALPEKQRLAVAYHHVAGLPYREVAALLGGTPEAARRAASDGIAALRTRLTLEES
ncbi:RNA polymerase sigma factor [Herbiconiux sp. SYSU D00978]|uniref:RNA polymerase sigma factor n=1 Tax=Herbiconiux sp. SYSU D00978 TaxID=2812562 RepID=UPI001A972D88|nr:sigma-70 family RNA polymerase sigma factor [Herbiconiux sp. SYSU D00978]